VGVLSIENSISEKSKYGRDTRNSRRNHVSQKLRRGEGMEAPQSGLRLATSALKRVVVGMTNWLWYSDFPGNLDQCLTNAWSMLGGPLVTLLTWKEGRAVAERTSSLFTYHTYLTHHLANIAPVSRN
jgi:hypothetical protein